MPNNTEEPTVYISYAWNPVSEKIADTIEREFNNRKINVIRDKKDLKYKGRIKEFMKDIGLGKYVILVISNKYLRSENCMFELLQIFKNQNFYERIFPVVLDDAEIAKAADRLELVKYWENEVNILDDKIRALDKLSNIQGVTEDLNLYSEIRNHIAELTNILNDINTLNADKHIKSDFQQLYTSLETQINKDFTVKNENTKRKRSNVGIWILAISLLFSFLFSIIKKCDETEPITEETSIPVNNEVYVVKLSVDPDMSDSKVYVDNKLTEILKRDGKDIFVKIRKKDSAHHFKVENKVGICETVKVIVKDSMLLSMSCKKTIAPIEYYTVKLLVDTNMTDGKVYVNNKPADVIKRGNTYIAVKVKKRSESHLFEVKNEVGFCEAEQVIEKDQTELIMNC